ncbi:MAG: mercuric reductase [Desulfobulbaceae bacterium]|nr:mercuric reductase [Desulfobulbaceae bacterium]
MSAQPLVRPENQSNRELVGNVHPPDWVNPEPAPRYNLVVVGAGTAGLVCAAGAAGLGARVALVERHLMGGDCLNVGCVPSKGLIRASRAIHDIRDGERFGIEISGDSRVDFSRAMERMQRIRADISAHDSAARFSRELGVDVFLGDGRFTGRDTLSVNGKPLRFKRAAICTGARAAAPPIDGLDEAGYLTNETVFSLTILPSRLVVIGAGPIGCELAQTFARLGSKVSLIQRSGRVLPKEDEDVSSLLQERFAAEGIDLYFQTRINKVTGTESGKTIFFEHQGEKIEQTVDEILVGVGRAPNVEGLGLEAAGVDYDPREGVRVNDRLQTTNPAIFAAGDICSSYKFTHTADAQARIVIANALFHGRQKNSSLVIPWCTYTDPEVAHVGMTGAEADDRREEVNTLTVSLAEVDRARLDGETAGLARVHLKKGSDRILGATVVARHAGEMISELTLAMTAGTGLSSIGKTIHPYPTQAEVIKKLADAYNRTRLTPFIKKVFDFWLKWQRR